MADSQDTILAPENTERAESFQVLYTNSSKVRISAFDIALTLGRQGEISPGKEGLVEQVTVYMSPQHLKILALSLNGAIAQYETQFGPVIIQTGFNALFGTTMEKA